MDSWDDFRSPLNLEDWHNVERRIGQRVPAAGIEVRWILPPETAGARDEEFLGRVVEVSVTGASIDTAASLPVEVPSKAVLRYADGDTEVTIRHASPSSVEGVTRFGVEWVTLEEPLRQVVFGQVADAKGSDRKGPGAASA